MGVLLTGSSGWLVQHLAPRLRTDGHLVTGVDVRPSADTHIVGSVADRASVERAFSDYGIEAVIHSGALQKTHIVHHPTSTFVDVNVTGTLNLMTAAVAVGHDRFIFTSTTSLIISHNVHRDTAAAASWLDEDFGPLARRNLYGVTKLTGEGLCRLPALEYGLNCILLRTARFFRRRMTRIGNY
jgi:UDP-glucose 4-epimerase